MNEEIGTTVVVRHSVGFFSCCSVRLGCIIHYFNTHECTLPTKVDSSEQFHMYKHPSKGGGDVTNEYFVNDSLVPEDPSHPFPSQPVAYHHDDQFLNYHTILQFEGLQPFLHKYFSPSLEILECVAFMEHKYNIDYANTCVLFYRGNDKVTETTVCPYDDMFDQAKDVMKRHSNVNRVLLQSDETQFLEQGMETFKDKSPLVFWDEIRHITKSMTSVDYHHMEQNAQFSKYFLAIIIILSKCHSVICTSGNCSIWIMMYRGHTRNVRQYLDDIWLCSV